MSRYERIAQLEMAFRLRKERQRSRITAILTALAATIAVGLTLT